MVKTILQVGPLQRGQATWAELIADRDLLETDLVRVERGGDAPIDARAGDVPELREIFDKISPPQLNQSAGEVATEKKPASKKKKGEIIELVATVGPTEVPPGASHPDNSADAKKIDPIKQGEDPVKAFIVSFTPTPSSRVPQSSKQIKPAVLSGSENVSAKIKPAVPPIPKIEPIQQGNSSKFGLWKLAGIVIVASLSQIQGGKKTETIADTSTPQQSSTVEAPAPQPQVASEPEPTQEGSPTISEPKVVEPPPVLEAPVTETLPMQNTNCIRLSAWIDKALCAYSYLGSQNTAIVNGFKARLAQDPNYFNRQRITDNARAYALEMTRCETAPVPTTCLEGVLQRYQSYSLNSEAESSASNRTSQQEEVFGSTNCAIPRTPENIDGSSATQADMVTARKTVIAYLRESQTYTSCLTAYDRGGRDVRIRREIDANEETRKKVGAAFNDAAKAFNSS